jgi:hypothetical protein
MITQSQRNAKARKALKEAGGKRIDVQLSREGVEALSELQTETSASASYTVELAIKSALERCNERPPILPDHRDDWSLDMDFAPRDRVINVVGRYPEATAGFPNYAMWCDDEIYGPPGFYTFSKNKPERVIVWAWRERGDWPEEPALEEQQP